MLSSDQVLTHFNPSAKLILTVDASPYGLGAVLSQIDSDGFERPISYASRTLTSAEKRYSQIQKEATAIIFGVRRYHQYLYGRSAPFILRTDHKPLISIFGAHNGIPEVSANRLQRYAMFLSSYNYSIEYVRSADNSADFLSRACVPAETIDAPCSSGAGGQDECDRAAYVCFVVEGSLPVTVKELRDATSGDVILNQVGKYIMNGWPAKSSDPLIKPYFLCRTQLSMESGCVMRGHKVVIPDILRQRVLEELHRSHLGIVKTKGEARSRFWFPGVDEAIEKLIGSCEVCIQMRPSPPRAPIAHWDYPPRAGHRIHIDFLGPLNGHMYLVVVDAYTKWLEVYDMNTSTTSAAVVEKLADYFSRFGLPSTLVSDNGTAFSSQEFKQFCNINGISHLTSPAYHPASNGQAESYVKIVKKGIKSCLMSCKNARDSKMRLLKYLFDYRNSQHSTTGYSPAQLVYGHKLRSRLDLINPITLSSSQPSPPALTETVKQKQCMQNEKLNRKNKKKFSNGDKILYKKYVGNRFKWEKGIVVRRLGRVLYLIKDCVTSAKIRKHCNQIINYKGTSNNPNHWDNDSDVQSESLPSPSPTPPPPQSPTPSLSPSLPSPHGATGGDVTGDPVPLLSEPTPTSVPESESPRSVQHGTSLQSPRMETADDLTGREEGRVDSNQETDDDDAFEEAADNLESSEETPEEAPAMAGRHRRMLRPRCGKVD